MTTFLVNPYYHTISSTVPSLAPTLPATTTATINTVRPIIPYFVPIYGVPINVDTGLNDNYAAQKQMTRYLQYRILDKYLFENLSYLLKFFRVDGNTVSLVKNLSEYENNDVSKDTTQMIELKADFLEKNYLTESKMRGFLTKIVVELGYKWYNLTKYESVVCEVVGRQLRKEFKLILGINSD